MAVVVAGVGYMGAKLVEDLLRQGEKVIGIDNLFSTDRNVIDSFRTYPGFRFCFGDVTEPSTFEEAFAAEDDISVVFSLAAQASAHPEAAEPRYTEETNLIGPRVMLDEMRRHGIQHLVYASSFRVYGQDLPPVIDRNTPFGAFSDLSHLSKHYVEKLLEMYSLLYGMHCVSLRFGVIYGKGPVTKFDPKFMTAPNKFCLQAVEGETIEVSPSGMLTSGFMHVEDASRVMQLAAQSNTSGYDFFDAVTELCSVAEVAQIVHEEASQYGLEVEARFSGTEELAPTEHTLENSVFALGFLPQHNLRSGMKEMIEYFQKARPK